MYTIISKIKIVGLLALSLLLLLTIKLEATASISSLYTPQEAKYIGVGFNSLTRSYIYDNSCLNFNSIETQKLEGVSNTTYYCFVNSKKELAEKFLYNFSTNVGMTPEVTAVSRVTDIILNNTKFSADKITLIAYWKQEDKKVFSNDLPTLSNEAFSILHTSSKKFYQLYGDKYVSSVVLGKMFFIVYQADISDYSAYSTRAKNAIKRAMELNLRKILGEKLSAKEVEFVNAQLVDISINSSTYGNEIHDTVGPYVSDDLKDILKKINLSKSTVISSELKDYSYTDNPEKDSVYDISEYLNMSETWNKNLSNLNYIESNSRLDADLMADCKTAINDINNQIKLVYSLDPDARALSGKETSFLNGLYIRYINEMKIAPRTYTMPPIEKQVDLDLSNINDVEAIQINCIISKSSPGSGGGGGGLFSFLSGGGSKIKPVMIILYVIDEDGNWSVVNRAPIPAPSVLNVYDGANNIHLPSASLVTIYNGVKFSDKFKIGFDSPRINTNDLRIIVSYLEKVDDLIWLQVNNKLVK
jgi:hypothetical protein